MSASSIFLNRESYPDPVHCACFSQSSVDNHRRGAHEDEAMKDLDSLLAKSMEELSFQDRQIIQEEVHGIVYNASEDPSLMKAHLRELSRHLNVIKQGSVYEMAECMNAAYVTNVEFQTMFLRANRYNAKAAAKQMIKFFEVKLNLFGSDKLVKDITPDDLDDGDKKALRSGCHQILPHADMGGRKIMIGFPGVQKETLVNELRALYFLMMNLAVLPDTQKRGITSIAYTVGHFRDNGGTQGFAEFSRLTTSIPIYFASFHYCCDDNAQLILFSALLRLAPQKWRARVKLHYGSHMECQSFLSAHGIPRSWLPLSPVNFELLTNSYNEIFLTPKKESDIVPGPDDVLFGKKYNNKGNQLLWRIVLENGHKYDSSTKAEKMKISKAIAKQVKSSGGRFLKCNQATLHWEEVDDVEILRKVARSFRNARQSARNAELSMR